MTSGSPFISVIVCTLNEERYIGALIDGIFAQEGVPGDVEVIVVDGNSTDRTVEIASERNASGRVCIFKNARRFHVYGFNLGAQVARGEYLAFVGAHAEYSPRYLATCLETMRRTGAANVGGVVKHAGDGIVGTAIAVAMSSRFGVGDSKFRHSQSEQDCDSVMGGFLSKRVFNAVGGFNETNIINQDGEFNYRLRKAGHRIVVSPSIESTYYVRSSFVKLAEQYRRYGFYRRWTEVQHPGSVPLRVYAPPLLVLGTAASVLTFAASGSLFALAIPASYILFLATAMIHGFRRHPKDLRVGVLVPLAATVMHFAFGIGWINGFFSLRPPNARHERPNDATVVS